jgi:hypothetical protein
VERNSAVFSLADIGSSQAARQLASLLALWPLLDRPEVVALVRSRLAHLDLLPTRLALELLVVSPDVDTGVTPLCAHELGAVATKLYDLSCEEPPADGEAFAEDPIDSWSLGATFLWDLLQRTGATAADALAASSHAAHAEAYDLCVFLAACLQPAAATIHWIEQAVRERPQEP